MPRPRFSNWLVADTFTVAASGTHNVDIDLLDTFYPQIMVMCTYASTASTAGLTAVVYPGFVTDVDQTVAYADNGNTVTEMVAPTVSSGTTQTKKSAFAINPELYPRFLRLTLTNTDTTNSVSVRIVGDR